MMYSVSTLLAVGVAVVWALLWWQGFLGGVVMLALITAVPLTPTPLDNAVLDAWRSWVSWLASKAQR